MDFNRLIESSLVLPLRGFIPSVFSDFQVWIDNVKISTVSNSHRFFRNISLLKSNIPSRSGQKEYSYADVTGDRLSIGYAFLCFLSLWIIIPIGAFFAMIVFNEFNSPLWLRILAVFPIPWAFYMWFYAMLLSFGHYGADARLWNFPAYFATAIIFIVLIISNNKLTRAGRMSTELPNKK